MTGSRPSRSCLNVVTLVLVFMKASTLEMFYLLTADKPKSEFQVPSGSRILLPELKSKLWKADKEAVTNQNFSTQDY